MKSATQIKRPIINEPNNYGMFTSLTNYGNYLGSSNIPNSNNLNQFSNGQQ